MLQEMVLMVTPGATCSDRPIVPVSPSWVDGGGEQAVSAADKKLETRIALRAWLRSVRMGDPPDVVVRNVGIVRTESRTRVPSRMHGIVVLDVADSEMRTRRYCCPPTRRTDV